MNGSWFAKAIGSLSVALAVACATGEALAQRPHYHDAAGHMVDRYGHHVDAYGRHTGGVGLYHGQYGQYGYGQYGYQQPYAQNYGISGGYYNAAPAVSPYVGTYNVPQNVVPYAVPQNVGGVIKIFNPADSGGDVNYTLNGTAYTIKPGSTQTLQNDRVWTVEFGSGGTAGNIRYSLQNGTYKFKVTDAGWNLFRSQDQGPAPISSIPPAPIPQSDLGGPRPGIVP